MVRSNLLILVKSVRLGEDIDRLLELLQLAHRSLLLLQPACLLDGHLPCVAHLLINLDVEVSSRQLLEHVHFSLEFLLLPAAIFVVEELRMQVVHDKVADLEHVEVDLFIKTQQGVILQLPSDDPKKLIEEFLEPREIQVALFKELIKHRGLSRLHDEVINSFDAIFNLCRVVALHLMWLHLRAVRFPEPGR